MSTRILLISLLWVLLAAIHHGEVAAQSQLSDPAPPTIARTTFAPVPLRSRDSDRRENASANEAPTPKTSTAPLVTIGSSLAIVLGLFAALVWVSRKASKNVSGNRELPDEAMKVLGKKSLGTAGNITLLRCGRSILIIGVHSTGMSRLGEIANDEEVRHLEALCTGHSKASFDETLADMQREPIKRGFIGEDVAPVPSAARRNLFSAT